MTNWVLNLLLGILAIILGIVALMYPVGASIGVELFTAWVFIILGIVVFVSAFTGNQTNGRIWTILLGILMFVTGIVLLRNPLAGLWSLSMVFGIMAIALGLARFFAGFKIRANNLKWLTILSGVASVILGGLVIANPAWSLGVILGVELIFDGVGLIALAFARKSGGLEA